MLPIHSSALDMVVKPSITRARGFTLENDANLVHDNVHLYKLYLYISQWLSQEISQDIPTSTDWGRNYSQSSMVWEYVSQNYYSWPPSSYL